MKIGIIIPAGGQSKRFNGIYKPFLKINGKTIIEIIIEKFFLVPEVVKIVIPVNKKYLNPFTKIINSQFEKHISKIKIIPGGKERQFSVFSAFTELMKNDTIDTVVIHDAVRPFVDLKLLTSLLSQIKNCNAVIPVKPVTETVKYVNGNFVKDTLDRTKLFLSLTPQVFKKKILEYAYKRIDLNKYTITDEARLLELVNMKVKAVLYKGYNIKITYPGDYELVKLLFNSPVSLLPIS
ncbi:MAG: IspD/TarI family cytidylyltransferase [Planctomycetota bacterium]